MLLQPRIETNVRIIERFDGQMYAKVLASEDLRVKVLRYDLQVVFEVIKPLFLIGYYQPTILTTTDKPKQRYLAYRVPKDQNGTYASITPCGELSLPSYKELRGTYSAQFKHVIFFRYLMGLKTQKDCFAIMSWGDRVQVLSDKESRLPAKRNTMKLSGPYWRFKNGDSDEEGGHVLFIDARKEMQHILGTDLSSSSIASLFDHVRDLIRSVAPKYTYMVDDMRERLYNVLELTDEELDGEDETNYHFQPSTLSLTCINELTTESPIGRYFLKKGDQVDQELGSRPRWYRLSEAPNFEFCEDGRVIKDKCSYEPKIYPKNETKNNPQHPFVLIDYKKARLDKLIYLIFREPELKELKNFHVRQIDDGDVFNLHIHNIERTNRKA